MGEHHHHNHAHGCAHHHAPANYDRAFAVGVTLNLLYVAFCLYAGVQTNSLALIADAWHNLGDVASLLIAWGAAWLSRKPPSQKRTYGFGRSSILAALINALLLLIAAGGIVWGAFERLQAPEPIATTAVMWIAALGVVINTGTALMFLRGSKTDINIRGAFLHMTFDAALSVGVVIAAFTIGRTGWLWLDPATGLIIVAFIAAESFRMLRDSLSLTMDFIPSGVDRAEVEGYLLALPGVTEIHDLHIWPLSTTSVALTAHLVRPEGVHDDAWIFAACDGLQEKFGIDHPTLQIERGTDPAACRLAADDVI